MELRGESYAMCWDRDAGLSLVRNRNGFIAMFLSLFWSKIDRKVSSVIVFGPRIPWRGRTRLRPHPGSSVRNPRVTCDVPTVDAIRGTFKWSITLDG